MTEDPLRAALEAAHGALEEKLGVFLTALARSDADTAGSSIVDFDAALRRYTEAKERWLYPPRESERLVPAEDETPEQALYRQLALEHVQLRELSGMLCRIIGEKSDIEGARRLVGRLLGRWDGHSGRTMTEALPAAAGLSREARAAAAREIAPEWGL
ncbi:MAG TPA: hypothetical protein VIA29_00970 [Thermoanaerobaculia bacterium]|jgi:hypothetical protein